MPCGCEWCEVILPTSCLLSRVSLSLLLALRSFITLMSVCMSVLLACLDHCVACWFWWAV